MAARPLDTFEDFQREATGLLMSPVAIPAMAYMAAAQSTCLAMYSFWDAGFRATQSTRRDKSAPPSS